MSVTLDDVLAAAAELQAEQKPRRSPGQNQGRPPADKCGRGHDMSVHGRPTWRTMPDGSRRRSGRYCAECKRLRQRRPGAPARPTAQKPRRPLEEQAANPSRRRRGTTPRYEPGADPDRSRRLADLTKETAA